jgi:hypothetical protein
MKPFEAIFKRASSRFGIKVPLMRVLCRVHEISGFEEHERKCGMEHGSRARAREFFSSAAAFSELVK